MIVGPIGLDQAKHEMLCELQCRAATGQRGESVNGEVCPATVCTQISPTGQHVDEWLHPAYIARKHRTKSVGVKVSGCGTDLTVSAAPIRSHTNLLGKVVGNGTVP